ncbi:MAG: hypothetical protein RLN76_10790 [Phycisphaeraceae bacterium]
MADTTELKARFEARKKEVEAQLADAKADAQAESNKRSKQLQEQLDELQSSVADGWENLSQGAIDRLSDLLRKN